LLTAGKGGLVFHDITHPLGNPAPRRLAYVGRYGIVGAQFCQLALTRRQGGQSHAHSHNGHGLAQLAAQLQLLFEPSHLGLAFRAGAGAVPFVLALGGSISDVVGLCHLHAHLLEGVAYHFSSFHYGFLFNIRTQGNLQLLFSYSFFS
jgi:hypothetical protein